MHVGVEERKEWRADLDPKIQVVRELAGTYGVHPTLAGHAALAAAWLRLVT
ncbi:hypothetical protein [Microbispora sp. KK1-11]|uniref:hypothetical protein n=1 Tax=Microbispora sp. KK1-11 TaxID=2053005 RepID=UPI001C8E5EEB|nr:hypothetical protein [Microbispora sp. KK1-11]